MEYLTYKLHIDIIHSFIRCIIIIYSFVYGTSLKLCLYIKFVCSMHRYLSSHMDYIKIKRFIDHLFNYFQMYAYVYHILYQIVFEMHFFYKLETDFKHHFKLAKIKVHSILILQTIS